MALTVAQKISIFQILDVPYSTSYNTLDGMGSLSAQTDMSGASQSAAYTAIVAYLATLDSSTETVLAALITEWDAIGSNSIKIENGSLGSLTGVFFNYDTKKANIEARVKSIVPFYKYHEVLERKMGTSQGVNITVMR